MKKIIKYILILLCVLFIGIAVFFIYMQFVKIERMMPLQAMHSESVLVIETKNLTSAWKEVKNSALWESIIEGDYFEEYEANMMTFDSLMVENTLIRNIFKDRPLAISVQMLGDNNFETVFAIDIGKYGQIAVLPKLAGLFDFKMDEYQIDSVSVYRLQYDKPKDVIHLCIYENLLIGSLSSKLTHQSISAVKEKSGFRHSKFMDVKQESLGGLLNFYINYNQIANFAGCFAPELKDALHDASQIMAYSALQTHLKDKNIKLTGHTNYYDTVPSIVNALVKAEAGKLEAHNILPSQTAFFISINTANFQLFYNDLLQQYQQVAPDVLNNYQSGLETAEKWLDVDFNDILFSWIEGEFVLAKQHPQSNARELDALMVIKANDIDLAKEKLDLLLKHIRKRTPVRFDQITYRNHHIHLLQMKGFFKLFVGSMMEGIEKPYFTYIDDYVVFSNSVNSLMSMIDDYLVGNTIARTPSFKSFIEQFDDESNFSLFVQMPKIYQHLYYYSDSETQKSLKKNKNLLINFANIGWQLNTNGQTFETTLLAKHDENALMYEELEKMQNAAEELYIDEYRNLQFKMRLDDTFPWKEGHIEYWVTHPDRVQDSLMVHEGEMRDSLPQDLWRSYHTNGQIKAAIPYDDGEVDGTAIFYFNDLEHTVKAEVNFNNDILDGSYKEYYSNGRKKVSLSIDDGLFDGEAIFYYRNGQIKIEGKYKNGLRHGKWRYYTKSGDLINKESWRKGKE